MSEAPEGMPDSVFIGGTTWTIHYVADYLKRKGKFGKCYPGRQLIKIALDQCPEQMRRTLIHEVVHAALTLCPTAIDSSTHETIACALEVPILNLVRDNAEIDW